jgi:hypothetical protein
VVLVVARGAEIPSGAQFSLDMHCEQLITQCAPDQVLNMKKVSR